ncbi:MULTISPECIES: hypothetical protein [unclassified Chelatococcus]|nr:MULTISPECIES: hypothetical protein [unclassified Chelatococcus]
MRIILIVALIAAAVSACASRESNYWADVTNGTRHVVEGEKR